MHGHCGREKEYEGNLREWKMKSVEMLTTYAPAGYPRAQSAALSGHARDQGVREGNELTFVLPLSLLLLLLLHSFFPILSLFLLLPLSLYAQIIIIPSF